MSDHAVLCCELEGHQGKPRAAVGRFQVYDPDLGAKPMPTIDRPALLCQVCLDFAGACGMDAKREGAQP